jgi:hypothetical protein
MKFVKAVLLTAAAVICAGVLAQPARAEVSFDLAYSNLSEHGSWMVSAQYGHVWQPNEYNREWNPYYDGHWIYTDMGWAWVSDYEWGSIPYHYGTWVSDPDDGWVWVPGRVWAPSWVVFRTGPDYIGWAPVPVGYSVGMSINFGGPSSFVYVSSHNFLAPRVRMSIIPREQATVFMNNTTVVNNIVVQNNVVVNRGPDYRSIERATGSTIREERIETVTRVAPFANVSRAQLAVDPVTAKAGVRVAEPVPASQPLPVADKNGNHGRNTPPAEAPQPSAGRPPAQESTHGAPPPPAAVTPDASAAPQAAPATPPPARQDKGNAQHAADAQALDKANAQKNADAQAHAKANAQHTADAQALDKANAQQSADTQAHAKANAQHTADAQALDKANAQKNADAQAHAKANAQQNADAQARTKANAQQSADAQAHAKANAQQSADAQAQAKANAQQSAKAQADAKANAEQSAKAQADTKANAQQSAKAQADAKAKADQNAKAQAAKAKKNDPNKPPPPKDQGGDKGSAPETNEQPPQ